MRQELHKVKGESCVAKHRSDEPDVLYFIFTLIQFIYKEPFHKMSSQGIL